MKKFTLTIIGMLICQMMVGQIERDKVLHYVGGNLYGLAGAGIASQISDGDRVWTYVGAIGASAAVGVAKEAIDAGKENNQWDNEDLLATVLGGLTIGITLDIFTNDKKKKKSSRERASITDLNFVVIPLEIDEGSELPTLTFLATPSLFETD